MDLQEGSFGDAGKELYLPQSCIVDLEEAWIEFDGGSLERKACCGSTRHELWQLPLRISWI